MHVSYFTKVNNTCKLAKEKFDIFVVAHGQMVRIKDGVIKMRTIL